LFFFFLFVVVRATAGVGGGGQEQQVEVETPEVIPDRNVKFHETVATVIEDDANHHDEYEEEEEEEKVEEQQINATPEPTQEYKNNGVDAQNESENDDIDIEKEFVMPAETEKNNNVDAMEQSKVANGGGRTMTRMDSNDIILDGEDKPDGINGSSIPSTGDEGLDSILARKALVRQQVQKFEKTSPGQGAVKYSIRSSSAKQEQPAEEVKSDGSNVKNLKNFFQRLSTTSDSTTSPSGGAVKPVGKLKVTFPAS